MASIEMQSVRLYSLSGRALSKAKPSRKKMMGCVAARSPEEDRLRRLLSSEMKIWWACRVNAAERYRRLAEFAETYPTGAQGGILEEVRAGGQGECYPRGALRGHSGRPQPNRDVIEKA